MNYEAEYPSYLELKERIVTLQAKNEELKAKWKLFEEYDCDEIKVAYAILDKRTAERGELLAALKPILAISDRKHDAWDHAHALITKYEGEKHG